MDLQGDYTYDAALDPVWTLLMDVTAIAACVPGCRALRPLGDDRFEADLVVAVAAVTGTYEATITIEDKEPPRTYALVVDATGRRGFLRGRAVIELAEDQGKTVVHVQATGDVGGTVARVGQRLLQGAGRMMMDRFFKCLRRRLSPPGATECDAEIAEGDQDGETSG
jgi:uncharacterized protein